MDDDGNYMFDLECSGKGLPQGMRVVGKPIVVRLYMSPERAKGIAQIMTEQEWTGPFCMMDFICTRCEIEATGG